MLVVVIVVSVTKSSSRLFHNVKSVARCSHRCGEVESQSLKQPHQPHVLARIEAVPQLHRIMPTTFEAVGHTLLWGLPKCGNVQLKRAEPPGGLTMFWAGPGPASPKGNLLIVARSGPPKAGFGLQIF